MILLFFLACPLGKNILLEGDDTVVDTAAEDDSGNTDTDTPTDTFVTLVDLDGDGFTESAGDCNDQDATVYPGAVELCNEVDDDCDGTADNDAVDASVWYMDLDLDGYGNASVSQAACLKPTGYVADNTDCDDTDNSIYPDAVESCDEQDNDCDGMVDEDVETTFYADRDADGYGDLENSQDACTQPTGYVADNTDCSDGEADTYPGADEWCDSRDNDCDGTTDEDPVDGATFYLDADGDGSGDPSSTINACTAPAGYQSNSLDCDDTNAYINPSITETCDGVDNDCDGTTDEDDAEGTSTWYVDADGDGYGDADASAEACEAPSGYVSNSDDCNDSDSAMSPAASEQCNEKDDDCDGLTDNSALDATTWYEDQDGDGYGNVDTFEACDMPSGHSATGGDCDDYDDSVYPGADEWCDSVDEDCDGTVDNDAVDAAVWYLDADGDGYGDVTTYEWSCDQPVDGVSSAGDADDTDASVYWSSCQQVLVGVGYDESDLWSGSYDQLGFTIELSTGTDYVVNHWEDATAPTGIWLTCGSVSSLQGTVTIPGDTSISRFYANTYSVDAYGAWYGWDATIVTSGTRSDGTPFHLDVLLDQAQLVP